MGAEYTGQRIMEQNEETLQAFAQALREAEKSSHTIEKYLRDVRRLMRWLDGSELTRERMLRYKEELLHMSKSMNSINSYIVSANVFLEFLDRQDLRIKTYPVQQEAAQPNDRQLTKPDYDRLMRAARKGGNRTLVLVLETLASTGMRVSELSFLTVEGVGSGIVRVYNKGKVREVCLPGALGRQLLRYAAERGYAEGAIFRSRKGTPLSRVTIWRWMKQTGERVRVGKKKVYPHNLRKLFARELYRVNHRDIAHVADTLGHSNVNTTRRYIRQNYSAHLRLIEQLGFLEKDFDENWL